MVTFSSPVSIDVPKTGQGGGGTRPPAYSGGGDGPGDGSPDYGQRLRRVRLGLAIGLTSVTMIFVSLTSAYVVRRGLPTLDESTNKYVRDWIPVDLPITLLLINTGLLLVSSITAELARRQITRQAALAPVRSIPGVSLGEDNGFPWLGVTVVLGTGFLAGQWMAWRELADRGFYLATSASSSFVYLLTATHAVHLTGRHFGFALCGCGFSAAQAGRGAPHCGGCYRLVLAFHVFVVAVHFRAVWFIR